MATKFGMERFKVVECIAQVSIELQSLEFGTFSIQKHWWCTEVVHQALLSIHFNG